MQSTNAVDFSKKWYVLASVGTGILLATIDGSIVNVALPTLAREFQADFAVVEWVLLGYLLTVTTLMLSMGRLADMVGKKGIYTAGFVVFTVGSVLCGLAPTIYWLIGFRILQAFGAAMMFALGIAIITEAFPGSERGKAMGIAGTIVTVGIVSGPVLGGLIIEALSWHWIFFVNIPVGIVGTWMAMQYIPAVKPPGGQTFDYVGGALLFVSLLSLMLALTIGQHQGFTQPYILALFATWIITLVAFLGVEWHTPQPMIELSLFRNRLFSINLITGFLSFVAIGGVFLLMPFYLENMQGFDTRTTGLLLASMPITMGIASPISGILSDRFGPRLIIVIGLLTMVAGYYGVSTLTESTPIWIYILIFVPIGVGIGIFQSPNNSAVMGAVAKERLGIASGLLSITRTLGQVVGIATIGAIWSSRTFMYASNELTSATEATIMAQVRGLQETFIAVTVLMMVALGLGIWALMEEWRGEQTVLPPTAKAEETS